MHQTGQNDVDTSRSFLLDAKLITANQASSSLGTEACAVWWIRCCCCPEWSRHLASSSSAACRSAASERNLEKERREKGESQPGSAQLLKVWRCAQQTAIQRGFTAHHFPHVVSFQNGFNSLLFPSKFYTRHPCTGSWGSLCSYQLGKKMKLCEFFN